MRASDVDTLSDWPSIDRDEGTAFVPFRISYTEDGGVISWGFQANPNECYFRDLTAFLEVPVNRWQGIEQGTLAKVKKREIDVLADFLSAIWGHTIDTLCSRFGSAFVATTLQQVVVTMPISLFQTSAKNKLREAIDRSKIPKTKQVKGLKLEIISDLEAAAQYFFHKSVTEKVSSKHSLKKRFSDRKGVSRACYFVQPN
jgi:hypothetical protein